MKNIIIFEGIASSGKTTIEKLLARRLSDVAIISEDTTLMPLIDNKDADIANEHLKQVIEIIRDTPAENIIIDRFHLTHAFRTQSNLIVFSEIEKQLQDEGNVLLILLTIDPEQIEKRIEETVEYRQDNWKKGAQGNISEKVLYYTNQQKALISLLSTSRFTLVVLNTTTKNWSEYVDVILNRL